MYIAITTRPGGPETNLGWISVDRHAPVATYTLHTTANDGSPVEAVLKDYSRWSEPAAALVARCFALLPQQSWLVDKPHTGFLGVAISFGLDHDFAWTIERAYSWGHCGGVVVDWHDGEDAAETVTVAVAVPEDINAALLQTLRLAAWKADAMPPVPAPLSKVRVVTHNGRRCVRLTDVPRHARRHVERRAAYAVADGHLAEEAWAQFIGHNKRGRRE